MEDAFRAASRLAFAGGLATAALSPVSAQEARFFYPAPAAGTVTVSTDVQYGRADSAALRMDLYRAANATPASPVLIFFNGAVGRERQTEFSAAWARVAAAKGLVAIVPDIHSDHAARDFDALLAYLAEHGGDYGADRDAIAVYAGSGNVYTALPIVEDRKYTAVKAAVIYYGTAPVTEFRRDLPVLYVRAGLDRPSVTGGPTSGMISLAARAIAQNAPWTLLNDPTGHHAFEMIDDDDATRDVIDRTIDFVKRTTSASYQAALRRGLPEAMAAAQVVAGDFHAATLSYEVLVASHPDDARLRLSYGEALLGDAQFASACAQLRTLKGRGLGVRDLALPAARACVQAGSIDEGVAWLESIPKRFLSASVATEPAFAAIRSRKEFRALFDP
jgi:dienelactone hydrolase